MVVHHRVWTGTDGVYIVDQMQYLAWIRDASNHVLSSNLFVLRPTPHDYFQPAVADLGRAHRAGRGAVAGAAAVEAGGGGRLFLGGTSATRTAA